MKHVNLFSLITACLMPLHLWAAELNLVMVEQDGCIYCARWDAEIAPIWPKTDVGQAAPLRRIDMRKPVPDDLDLYGVLVMTPTFIVTIDGVEYNRIEGYPSDDFFWPLIEHMVQQAQDAAEEE